jgi:hypothetical protein
LFEHDREGWQHVWPPHKALSTLLVNFICSIEASAYLSSTVDSVPHHYAPGTAEMVFPHGLVSLPWDLASSRLDVLKAIQSVS